MMRILLLLLLALPLPTTAAEPLRLAVAANFRGTAEQINRQFTADTGIPVRLSSASTGVLATQILHGAPFDLFLAADRKAPLAILQAGLGSSHSCYALGKLALVGGKLTDLADAGRSLAIANPDTAPYGSAAAEVLGRPDFASATQRKLVRGNNVLQAFGFWRSGAVDMALVAASLAPESSVPVPAAWHKPLEQHLIALRPGPAVSAYLNWLRSDTVQALIMQAGYQSCP